MVDLKSLYFKLREPARLNPHVSMAIYLAESLRYSNFGDFRRRVVVARGSAPQGSGVALCCRIRDEARYLTEFVEYYLAAGVDHFFFYEKLSLDDFAQVLAPYIRRGQVTLCADWPHVPVSPAAEQDCILKCIGRFKWVGFIDADEFVVVKDGRSIEEFLSGYLGYPAVALHWRMFGSNGHKTRPAGPVIGEYTRRESLPNRHVKCFVQPEQAARYRNSHSWFYLGMRCAVNELKRAVIGSISQPPTAEHAWINHYHHKSDQDYFEKAARKSVLDTAGIKFKNRTLERHTDSEAHSNDVKDETALTYYLKRCRTLARQPILAEALKAVSSDCEVGR
jgi:hypothetical protein